MSNLNHINEWAGLPVKTYHLGDSVDSKSVYRIAFDIEKFHSSSSTISSFIQQKIAESDKSPEDLPGSIKTGGGEGYTTIKFDDFESKQIPHIPDATELLDDLLSESKSEPVTGLVFGINEQIAMGFPEEVTHRLIREKEQLPNLQLLYLGEVTEEECPLHDIFQSDVGRSVLEAFPGLVELRARGGSDETPLQFNECRHICLEKLVLETAGLKREVLHSLSQSIIPELQSLELWFGSEIYGCDVTQDDIEVFLSNDCFPKLNHIAARYCEIPGVLPTIVKSTLMHHLQSIDLSGTTLNDEDCDWLLNNDTSTQFCLSKTSLSPTRVSMLEELENVSWSE